MLTLSRYRDTNCETVTRRSALEIGALSGLGLSLPALLAAEAQAKGNRRHQSDAAARNCILIWTRGGTSHHDTVDPKPDAPASVRGEFGVIDTAVPGIQFADTMPNMAAALDQFGLLRSWNPKNGSHGTADQYVMSGRKFNQAMHYPCFGSVVSWHLGFRSALPPFVQLGSQIDRRFGGGMPGILGLEHGPFEMENDPNGKDFKVSDITPPGGITMDRVKRRASMLERVEALQQQSDLQPAAFAAVDKHVATAFNMITAPETKRAFDLASEPDLLRDAYGRNRFGQSCLLARRLVQSGVRFVTVTDGGWDTHQNNFKSLKNNRLPPVDQALPVLLSDLADEGLLDETLVLWLTDFGRTPKVNSASGRDHWASAGFAIMAGAGIPGGSVIGATDDEGGAPVRDEYFSEDIATTLYHKLGLPEDLTAESPDGRPVRLLEGRLIQEWI